ncbi:hypothetical protein Mapa_012311 [Marchantia paleacea]|nr:hypothetical protein Mapa_012311 [Marchantia paleacea]
MTNWSSGGPPPIPVHRDGITSSARYSPNPQAITPLPHRESQMHQDESNPNARNSSQSMRATSIKVCGSTLQIYIRHFLSQYSCGLPLSRFRMYGECYDLRNKIQLLFSCVDKTHVVQSISVAWKSLSDFPIHTVFRFQLDENELELQEVLEFLKVFSQTSLGKRSPPQGTYEQRTQLVPSPTCASLLECRPDSVDSTCPTHPSALLHTVLIPVAVRRTSITRKGCNATTFFLRLPHQMNASGPRPHRHFVSRFFHHLVPLRRSFCTPHIGNKVSPQPEKAFSALLVLSFFSNAPSNRLLKKSVFFLALKLFKRTRLCHCTIILVFAK